MTEVVIRDETNKTAYKFLVDSDYEFSELKEIRCDGIVIEQEEGMSQKVKGCWDVSFGKEYCDKYTEKQQETLKQQYPCLFVNV